MPVELADGGLGSTRFTLERDGEIQQRGSSKEMLHSVDEIIAFASKYFTLEPGDMIFTGSPAEGQNPIKAGDTYKGFINKKCLFTCRIEEGAREKVAKPQPLAEPLDKRFDEVEEELQKVEGEDENAESPENFENRKLQKKETSGNLKIPG